MYLVSRKQLGEGPDKMLDVEQVCKQKSDSSNWTPT